MSAGVSDQMKIPGNTAKNVEERNIPWSQQVDEASYENLDSPTNDDNSASANQNSMQFQYPPFIAKETPNYSWNNKSRKPTNNVESNKKYGKPLFYNNAKRDDFQPNAWGANNARKTIANNASSNFNRPNRTDDGFLSGKLDNRPGNAAADDSKRNNAPPPAAAPKKTTWASIASQPAKLTSRTTLTATSHKKKGPGMPPPPMVPGKHNLDVNTWDSPNNNPPPVPSPPPPIEQPYVEISPLDFSPVVTVVPEHDMLQRPERSSKNIDIPRNDDKSSNFNSNFGRVRTSPNGHSRKNWSQQHPLHQNRQQSTVVTAGPARRGGEDTASSGPTNRYGGSERRGYFPAGARSEQESHSYDYRDENSPRNVELTTRSNHEELAIESPQAVLDELRDKNNYNPADIDLDKASSARFFVIKSYSEDDIHRSIKYEIWCSTDHGNKRLDDAFKERHKEGGNVLLFFSVNGSGHFCGMAQMMTAVDYNSTSSVWSQDKWKGKFKVKWIYVKDVPNIKLRHIRLENNENKPVTKSRDTQEVRNPKGVEVLQILHSYKHSTSIFDDFYHYEKKQEEEVSLKKPLAHDSMGMSQNQSPVNRHYNRQNDDRERDRDRDRDGRAGGAQKYFGPNGGNGGGGIGSGSVSGSGGAGAGGVPSFRDRNNPHRVGAYHNYNDHRRFESHRTGGTLDYQQQHQQKERDIDADRENSEYGGSRQKFDYQRRDERMQIKHNNRDRDFSDDQGKSYPRFRAGPREMQKDNEYPVADRARGSTDY